VVTGSFVVQTDISTAPVVAVIGGLAVVVWLATSILDLARLGLGDDAPTRRRAWFERRHWVTGSILAVGGLAVVLVMWLPPFNQQRSNHPGNLTLIARFFTDHHGTYPFVVGWRSLLSVDGVLFDGPGGVMNSNLGFGVVHPGAAWTVMVLAGLAALVAIVVGIVQRNRFASGIGMLALAGSAAVVISAAHVVGLIFGYLLIWAVVLPVAAFISPGLLTMPGGWGFTRSRSSRPVTASTGLRVSVRRGCRSVCGGPGASCVHSALDQGRRSHSRPARRSGDSLSEVGQPRVRR
jgi:hypothetical protein